MVKDYKHIHPVDWDEDYDDSDGGYSDYKGSSGEEDEVTGKRRRKRDSNYTSYSILGRFCILNKFVFKEINTLLKKKTA
jgi:hypothetical protein